MTACGHCLCGKTWWEYGGEATWACHCHCNDRRRNRAAPVAAWIGVPVENFKWTGKAPKTFESSEGVYRHFCEDCGTPMGFEADRYQGEIQVYAASLLNPLEFEPGFHVYYESKLPWLRMNDNLVKYEGARPRAPEAPGDPGS
ncbi:MAG: GFA family protein [Rhodobacteraceae bacterium]|nr:GFA family protein [Paracoccaceae bacterium]